jgi:two-component system response regulator RegX3
MVVAGMQPDRRRRHSTERGAGRSETGWLILADARQAEDLGPWLHHGQVRVVSSPARFRILLLTDEPRVVVCGRPPADRDTLDLVLAERRRRPSMRAVHVAPPDAVAEPLEALEAGFDDALPSTVPARELLGRLAWLEGRWPRYDHLPVAPGLDFDPVGQVLCRGNGTVHLRPKELGLLAVLASNPRRAFSRRQLLDLVWGPGAADATRTLDVHVRWLRSKIEPVPARPEYLVTVRGIGYRLDPPTR